MVNKKCYRARNADVRDYIIFISSFDHLSYTSTAMMQTHPHKYLAYFKGEQNNKNFIVLATAFICDIVYH